MPEGGSLNLDKSIFKIYISDNDLLQLFLKCLSSESLLPFEVRPTREALSSLSRGHEAYAAETTRGSESVGGISRSLPPDLCELPATAVFSAGHHVFR